MEHNHGTTNNPGDDGASATFFFGLVLGAAALLALLIVALVLSSHFPPERQIHGQPAFERAAEKAVFSRLLAKHGLQYDVSIIYEDHLGKYFIRGGKRCNFK